jgi:hypothetical protein
LLDKGNFVRDGVDTKRVVSTALEALTILVALQGIAAEFDAAQQAAYEKAAALRRAGNAVQQPFLGDVKSRCKSFMQQADHAVGALLNIVRLFYPEMKKLRGIGCARRSVVRLARTTTSPNFSIRRCRSSSSSAMRATA